MDRVGQMYRAVAPQYIDLFGSTDRMHAEDLAFIARHLAVGKGTVLDVGCGPGHLTGYMCALGVDCVGIDQVPKFINHARTAYPGARFELGSMHELTSTDGLVTGLLSWYSLIHLAPVDLDATLREFRRVVGKGCALVVGFFAGEAIESFDHKVTMACRRTGEPTSLRRLHRDRSTSPSR
jgi:ubiquinone/menaquinone biosynthesis C-methylase UbiE